MTSVVDMICHCMFKMYPRYHDLLRQILTGGLESCKFLIVLDGLDEMKGSPDIDVDMTRCTVLFTSRHWKFHCLSPDINDQDKVVEICGLDANGVKEVIEKILVNYFKVDASCLAAKVEEMLGKTRDTKLKSIMNIPLLLTASVHLWQTNTSTEESLTGFFCGSCKIC